MLQVEARGINQPNQPVHSQLVTTSSYSSTANIHNSEFIITH
jgi:hypothetical protein